MSPSPTSRLRRSLAAVHLRRSAPTCAVRALCAVAGCLGGRPASHTDTVSLAVAARRRRAPGRGVSMQLEAAVGQPLRDLRVGEAQPLVRVLLAQELELVGREIDDQQAPARRQHARRLAHGALRVAQEVQHLVHHHGVGGLVGERQIVDVALAHLGVRAGRRARAWRARRPAWPGSDRCRGRAGSARANSSSMRPVPVPRSTKQIERARAQRLGDGGLHLALRPRAARGCCPTRRRAPGNRPGPPARAPPASASARRRSRTSTGSARSTASSTSRASVPPSAALGQPEIDPAALRRPLHQPGLGQQLQMPADARLALPEDAREVLDVQLARGQQHQQTQPRRLGHRLERRNRAVVPATAPAVSLNEGSNHIKISLCVKSKAPSCLLACRYGVARQRSLQARAFDRAIYHGPLRGPTSSELGSQSTSSLHESRRTRCEIVTRSRCSLVPALYLWLAAHERP